MSEAINQKACETLFTHARTYNGWREQAVTDRPRPES